jgi:dolichol kinase
MADEESGIFEYRRKGFHFFGGMIMLAMIHFLGKEISVLLFCAAALASLFVINSIAVRGRSAFEPLIELFERHNKRPMDGVLWFLMGTVSLLLFANQMEFVFAGVFVMAAGDAAAAIFGKKFGSVKWPYNKNKSVVGTLAFAVCSLPALLFGGSVVASIAIIACALLESLNWSLDDNIIAAIVFLVASYA